MAFSYATLIILLRWSPIVTAFQCYNPDGSSTSETDRFLCSPDSEYSACCTNGDMCTSQGFCKAQGDRDNSLYWRDQCTDQSWQSSNCPKYCLGGLGGGANGSTWQLEACSQTTFCCMYETNAESSCCDNSSRVFDAGPAEYLGGPTYTTSLYPVTLTTSISSTTAVSSASTSTVSIATSTEGATSPTTVTHSGLSSGTKAGIGVGSALGAILLVGLGAAVVIILNKSKARRKRAGFAGPAQSMSYKYSGDLQEEADFTPAGGSYRYPSELQVVPKPVEADPRAARGYRPVELSSD